MATLELFPAPRPRILVLSVLKTKDLSGILSELLPAFDSVIATTTSHASCRPLPELKAAVENFAKTSGNRLSVLAVADPQEALTQAMTLADPGGSVTATGSFSLVGALRGS